MEKPSSELKDTSYELFVGALSVLSIVNLAIEAATPDSIARSICLIIDGVLSVVFLADFLFRLLTADSKKKYFFREYGWADLLASVPIPGLKILRLFRIVRATRLMRRYGGRNMLRHLRDNAAQGALLVVFFLIILILEFGSIGIAAAEAHSADANIKTASDAIWWAYVSITTVGYGDRYPVTDAGRVWGILVLAAGVGLFGVLTGYLANVFLSPKKAKKAETAGPTGGPVGDDPMSLLGELRQASAAQRTAQEEFETKLGELERLLTVRLPVDSAESP